MKKYILVVLVLIVATVITVIMVQHSSRPAGQVPDLDAQMIETAKHLHRPTLTP